MSDRGILFDMNKDLPHPTTLNYSNSNHFGSLWDPTTNRYEPYPDSPTHKSNRNQDHLETLTFSTTTSTTHNHP